MAYCEKCGNQLSDLATACPQCGHPVRSAAASPAAPGAHGARRTEGTALASMILGILGLVGCFLVGPILALVFGSQAKTKIAQDPSLEGEGMAKAGVIMGWIGLALNLLALVLIIAVAGSSSTEVRIGPGGF